MVSLAVFEDRDDLDAEEMEQWRSMLQDRYRFYIMNPRYTEGAEFSLWIQEDDYEYPVLSSNTGGFATFSSRSKTVGDGIEPTEAFLNLVGLGFHEAMCFVPEIYFRGDHFERRYLSLYDGKPRTYEVWAASVLIDWLATGRQEIPEFEPLAHWAGAHSKFGVPALGEEPAPGDRDEDGDRDE